MAISAAHPILPPFVAADSAFERIAQALSSEWHPRGPQCSRTGVPRKHAIDKIDFALWCYFIDFISGMTEENKQGSNSTSGHESERRERHRVGKKVPVALILSMYRSLCVHWMLPRVARVNDPHLRASDPLSKFFQVACENLTRRCHLQPPPVSVRGYYDNIYPRDSEEKMIEDYSWFLAAKSSSLVTPPTKTPDGHCPAVGGLVLAIQAIPEEAKLTRYRLVAPNTIKEYSVAVVQEQECMEKAAKAIGRIGGGDIFPYRPFVGMMIMQNQIDAVDALLRRFHPAIGKEITTATGASVQEDPLYYFLVEYAIYSGSSMMRQVILRHLAKEVEPQGILDLYDFVRGKVIPRMINGFVLLIDGKRSEPDEYVIGSPFHINFALDTALHLQKQHDLNHPYSVDVFLTEESNDDVDRRERGSLGEPKNASLNRVDASSVYLPDPTDVNYKETDIITTLVQSQGRLFAPFIEVLLERIQWSQMQLDLMLSVVMEDTPPSPQLVASLLDRGAAVEADKVKDHYACSNDTLICYSFRNWWRASSGGGDLHPGVALAKSIDLLINRRRHICWQEEGERARGETLMLAIEKGCYHLVITLLHHGLDPFKAYRSGNNSLASPIGRLFSTSSTKGFTHEGFGDIIDLIVGRSPLLGDDGLPTVLAKESAGKRRLGAKGLKKKDVCNFKSVRKVMANPARVKMLFESLVIDQWNPVYMDRSTDPSILLTFYKLWWVDLPKQERTVLGRRFLFPSKERLLKLVDDSEKAALRQQFESVQPSS